MCKKLIYITFLYVLCISTFSLAMDESENSDWAKDALILEKKSRLTKLMPNTNTEILMVRDRSKVPYAVFKRWKMNYSDDQFLAIRESIFYKFCKNFGFARVASPYEFVKYPVIKGKQRSFTGVERFIAAYKSKEELKELDPKLRAAVQSITSKYGAAPLSNLLKKGIDQEAIINSIDPVSYGMVVFLNVFWRMADATLRNIMYRVGGGLCMTDTGDSLGKEVKHDLGMLKPQIMFLGKLAEKPFPKEVVELTASLKFSEIKELLLSLAPWGHFNIHKAGLRNYLNKLDTQITTMDSNIKMFLLTGAENLLVQDFVDERDKIVDKYNYFLEKYNTDSFVAMENRLKMFQDNIKDMAELPIAEFIFKHLSGSFRGDFLYCYEYGCSGIVGGRFIEGHGFNLQKSIKPELTSVVLWEKMYAKYILAARIAKANSKETLKKRDSTWVNGVKKI